MSEHPHPNADLLSAFVEGVLPEHERAQCLAHLAECSRCREVVFLTQEAHVVPTTPILVPAPARQRWFRPLPLLAVAAAVCVALLGAWLYLRSKTGAPPRELAAQVTPAPAPTPQGPAEAPAPKPVDRKAIPKISRRSRPGPKPEEAPPAPVRVPEAAPAAPPPATAEPGSNASTSKTQVEVPPAPKIPAVVVQTQAASADSSGISGTVTDQTGAAVPTATVRLRQLTSNRTTDAYTDPAGQFKLTGLAPGQYELQITKPGFRQITQRVELHPQELAAVKSTLEVGATTETVEVSAAASTVQTEMSSNPRRKRAVTPEPRTLPSKLPVEIMVTREKVILAVDSAGALFFSANSGKGWKVVKPRWTGKITDLVTPPQAPEPGSAQFQLTTDSGADWLSRDGRHWYPAPAPH